MTDTPRLIEVAFPLKQASLDSSHEKNMRHGHISALHIWPARRPLAACRAALIATLLPDPATPEQRQKLCQKIGGNVVPKVEKKAMPNGKTVERIKEETVGGILHWKRETENTDDLQWFRDEIRKAYGGRAPKVLDPFAGGGAIPLEAMRLGCEATAIDINPVAWFIQKCTLEYPQKLAGQKKPLPDFILRNRQFMEGFFKAQGIKGASLRKQLEKLGLSGKGDRILEGLKFEDHSLEADLAWHVRAWGQWVLDHGRRDLGRFYPTYADFEPLKRSERPYDSRPMQLLPLREDGTPDIDTLNAEFSAEYLADPQNPRWIAKPTVAYLWARTVKCKNCRAVLPLLKTRWIARTDSQRALLDMSAMPDRTGVEFRIRTDVPKVGSNNAQRREHDKRLGQGTMSRSGATCPCCNTIMMLEDLQVEGRAGRLGQMITTVAVDSSRGKEFRLPTDYEREVAMRASDDLSRAFNSVPYGLPSEYIVEDAKRNTWCVQYGLDQFEKLFTPRQLVGMGTIIGHIRSVREVAHSYGYSAIWIEAISAYLACSISRLSDFFNCGAQWKLDRATINHLFVRYAIPISWDFAEGNILGDLPGSYDICLSKVAIALATFRGWSFGSGLANPVLGSSLSVTFDDKFDAVVTDPPYYNAIGYAVVMDYFYVWLKRILTGLSPEFDRAFCQSLSPKWDNDNQDGELVDDASRHGGDQQKSKAAYERGMEGVFRKCQQVLNDEGRLVVVFAHKEPDAWETLASAIIHAGFVVDGSWPIQTEQASRMRALSSAALASSVWLICKKRSATARPGWDNKVLEEMRANITEQLRRFWDAGIRGPDFVWAATGPALEAYSKHPVVKKADEPGQVMSVSEFLHHVRRIVVDFVVGRVLSGDGGEDMAAADRLDDVTAYYLLHRHDFGFTDAPVGGCILYAISCGLSDSELADTWDVLSRSGGPDADDDDEEETDPDAEPEADGGSGSKVKLKTWAQRNRKNMGYEAPGGRPVPLIDRLHRLMHLWRAGEAVKVDEYLDDYGLRRHELFRRLLQSLIELSPAGSDERATLESISNHIGAKGAKPKETMSLPGMTPNAESENQ